MTTPTISTTGTAAGLFLIKDQNDAVCRIPKTSLGMVLDSSNPHAHSVSIFYNGGMISLLFDTVEDVAAFMASVDSQY